MVGSIEIGVVNDAAAMVAHSWRSVEVLVEGELTGIVPVSIGQEKVPVLEWWPVSAIRLSGVKVEPLLPSSLSEITCGARSARWQGQPTGCR